MSRLVAYTLLFLYGAAMLRPLAPVAEYAFQYDYIATVLCINRDKPSMKCNGACHLKKRLQETNPESSEGVPSLIRIADYPIGFPVASEDLSKEQKHPRNWICLNDAPRMLLNSHDIFHPPQILA